MLSMSVGGTLAANGPPAASQLVSDSYHATRHSGVTPEEVIDSYDTAWHRACKQQAGMPCTSEVVRQGVAAIQGGGCVGDLARWLGRGGPPPPTLAVDGFALPPGESVCCLLRDSDVVDVIPSSRGLADGASPLPAPRTPPPSAAAAPPSPSPRPAPAAEPPDFGPRELGGWPAAVVAWARAHALAVRRAERAAGAAPPAMACPAGAVEELAQLLRAAHAPGPQMAEAAERLRSGEARQGFGPALLQLVGSAAAGPEIRQAAALYFKNFVLRCWLAEASAMAHVDREPIRRALVPLMASAPKPVRAALGAALEELVAVDFPTDWPTLVDELVQTLRASTTLPAATAAMEVAHSVFLRYRSISGCGELVREARSCAEQFGPAHLEVWAQASDHVLSGAAAPDALRENLELLAATARVFFDLNVPALPAFFSENREAYLSRSLALLGSGAPTASTCCSRPDVCPLEALRVQICSNLALYSSRYDEDLQPHVEACVKAAWGLAVANPGTDLATAAMGLLSSMAATEWQPSPFEERPPRARALAPRLRPRLEGEAPWERSPAGLLFGLAGLCDCWSRFRSNPSPPTSQPRRSPAGAAQDPATLRALCEAVVLPNVQLGREDLELFSEDAALRSAGSGDRCRRRPFLRGTGNGIRLGTSGITVCPNQTAGPYPDEVDAVAMANVVAGKLQNVGEQLPRPVPALAWAEAPAPRAPSKPRSYSERPAAVRWLRHAVRKPCGGRPHSIRRPCGLRAAGPPASLALCESSAAGAKPLLPHGAAGPRPASPPELPGAGPAGSEAACDRTSGAPTSLPLGELRLGCRASGRFASEPRTLGDLPELQGSGAEVRTGLGSRASGRRVGEPHTFGDLPELQGSGAADGARPGGRASGRRVGASRTPPELGPLLPAGRDAAASPSVGPPWASAAPGRVCSAVGIHPGPRQFRSEPAGPPRPRGERPADARRPGLGGGRGGAGQGEAAGGRAAGVCPRGRRGGRAAEAASAAGEFRGSPACPFQFGEPLGSRACDTPGVRCLCPHGAMASPAPPRRGGAPAASTPLPLAIRGLSVGRLHALFVVLFGCATVVFEFVGFLLFAMSELRVDLWLFLVFRVHYDAKVCELIVAYVSRLLEQAKVAALDQEVLCKDACANLVMSLAGLMSSKCTPHPGRRILDGFLKSVVVPELGSEPTASRAVLRAACLKYVTVLRSHLCPATVASVVPGILRHMTSESAVVHTYAAHCLGSLLTVVEPTSLRSSPTGSPSGSPAKRPPPPPHPGSGWSRDTTRRRRYDPQAMLPAAAQAVPLMLQLLAERRGIEHNEYVARSLVQVLDYLQLFGGPDAGCPPQTLGALAQLVSRCASGPPANPEYAHDLFECAALLARAAAPTRSEEAAAALVPVMGRIWQEANEDGTYCPIAFRCSPSCLTRRPWRDWTRRSTQRCSQARSRRGCGGCGAACRRWCGCCARSSPGARHSAAPSRRTCRPSSSGFPSLLVTRSWRPSPSSC
ncbi:unnamed protein product [Prorocentrum cordatum]|uniref:Importin N-terminal domain-containing protein n=1 Tax=Prorocentrum cordatum TaxID=2364126 RepID=A0ABN9PUV2_9DINO|nr:unnamed protein product [Polarella glacialis]